MSSCSENWSMNRRRKMNIDNYRDLLAIENRQRERVEHCASSGAVLKYMLSFKSPSSSHVG